LKRIIIFIILIITLSSCSNKIPETTANIAEKQSSYFENLKNDFEKSEAAIENLKNLNKAIKTKNINYLNLAIEDFNSILEIYLADDIKIPHNYHKLTSNFVTSIALYRDICINLSKGDNDMYNIFINEAREQYDEVKKWIKK
jgi:hypothetical protein